MYTDTEKAADAGGRRRIHMEEIRNSYPECDPEEAGGEECSVWTSAAVPPSPVFMDGRIRRRQEALENRTMCAFGTRSSESKGRAVPEPEDPVRTCFQRDADRILHCNSFQREKDKTQVIVGAFTENADHYRTRMTHSLEVARVAKTAARSLGLNEDLAEASALAHDLGHTPFGHTGEAVLNRFFPFGFAHADHSIRIAEVLEKNGKGLNLSEEILDAVKHHSGLSNSPEADTPEGCLLPFADKIAYLTSDFHDAEIFGVVSADDLPSAFVPVFGHGKTHAMGFLMDALISGSEGGFSIRMEDSAYALMSDFRKWMFANVYSAPQMQEQRARASAAVEFLCGYYTEHPEAMPEYVSGSDISRQACDFIAGMTDRYAAADYTEKSGKNI